MPEPQNEVDAQTTTGSDGSNSWFVLEGNLLGELKRSRFAGEAAPGISGYDSLKEIKRGGQGVVFEARQKSTKRRVAIKVLLDSASYSTSGRRRFEREIDLAASLKHPNIVRVYDSGELDDGRKYFVMEYAEGVSLGEYAKSVGREPVAVLKAFLTICEAVQHAHLRGVIHRDLKPSNVRVDADGVARVLDFGIAKVAEGMDSPSGNAHSMATSTGQFLGSLPWVSPEQARGEQDQVDARSDVYSLGVVLYEMLSGEFPYNVTGAMHEAMNNIVTAPPLPIRQKVPALDEQVEVILAKALAKEPGERYQSVGELAADIRHHLAGEPILARREGAWKQVRRQAERYRAALIVGAIVLAVVSGLSVWAVRNASRAEAETKAAETAREKAERLSVRSQAAVEFLGRMLGAANLEASGGAEALTVLQALGSAGSTIERTFAEDHEVRAQLYRMMCRTYTALGKLDLAEESIRKSLAALEMRTDGSATDTVTLGTRADMYDVLLGQGKIEETIPELASVIELQRKDPGTRKENLSASLSNLGMAYKFLKRFPEAATAFQDSITVLGDDWRKFETGVITMNNLAGSAMDRSDYVEAERLYREALPATTALLGADHRQAIIIRSNLGMLLMDQGRYTDSQEMLLGAYESSKRLRGPDHPVTLAIAHNYGTLEHRMRNLDRAIEILGDTAARRDALYGAGGNYTLLTRANLTFALVDAKRFEEATAAAKKVLEGRITLNGEGSPEVLMAMNTVGQVLIAAGKLDEAMDLLNKALATASAKEGKEKDFVYGTLLGAHAECLGAMGRFEESEPEFATSLAIVEGVRGSSHTAVKRHREKMAVMYEAWGKPEKAAEVRGVKAE